MTPRDVVRVILAFGELYTKRRPNKLLFHDYETYAQLFQALPVEAATSKTLLPLLRVYRRMEVSHEGWVRSVCGSISDGTIDLEPSQLSELVRLLADFKLRMPEVFGHVAEVIDLKFAHFSEDNIGDFARASVALRHKSDLFLSTLQRELPFRMHEYAWWNLIDVAEMYLVFQIDDRDMIKRIGNEVFKLVFSMQYDYPVKALKIMAFLEATDERTFRLLIRNQLRVVDNVDPRLAADGVMACVALNMQPTTVYHRLVGARLYNRLARRVTEGITSMTAKKICDVLAALAKVGRKEEQLIFAIEGMVLNRSHKFHAEHLVSLLRDFSLLKHRSPSTYELLLSCNHELGECTPSALCLLPEAIFGQRNCMLAGGRKTGSEGGNFLAIQHEREMQLLADAARLLCKPGEYRLPSNPWAMRSKDDFWWKQLKQRHFRLRRRATAIGAAVETTKEADEIPVLTALANVSQEECLQLIRGCFRLNWRDEPLLEAAAAWLCTGRRHADLQPAEVADVLESFAQLNFTQPLLRAALEHSLLRVANEMPAEDWTRSLQGALNLGIGLRSGAVLALVRRCTSEVAFVPPSDRPVFSEVAIAVLRASEAEVIAGQTLRGRNPVRLPIEMQMLREAVHSMNVNRTRW